MVGHDSWKQGEVGVAERWPEKWPETTQSGGTRGSNCCPCFCCEEREKNGDGFVITLLNFVFIKYHLIAKCD